MAKNPLKSMNIREATLESFLIGSSSLGDFLKTIGEYREAINEAVKPTKGVAYLTNDQIIELIGWWKQIQGNKKYTIQIVPCIDGYLNLFPKGGTPFVDTANSGVDGDIQYSFTKAEIERLKECDDIAIDWDKAKIEPVEDNEC